MRRYLIVGNQTLAGGNLSAKVRELHERGPSSFYIVVPATPPHGHSWSEGEARDIARRRLETVLALLRGVGVEAEGEVGDERPTYAIQDVLAHRATPAAQTLVRSPPETAPWHTVTFAGRLPGLKFLRTLWVASLAGGPFQYTARELRDAHFDLKIPPEVFDEVDAELGRTLDHFNVPEREKGEVLAAFGGWKEEVTAGSKQGAVNWRRWH